jgi:hypothetical protein
VFAKSVTRIGCSLLQVSRKLQLLPQRAPAFDCLRLTPFPFPDFARNAKQFIDTLSHRKQTAVVVGENDIDGFDQEVTKASGARNAEESRVSSRCGPDGQAP